MELSINGSQHQVEVSPETPLLWVLRDNLGMVGTKYGCGLAQCGVCTVLIDGQAVRSCATPVESVSAAAITTIEAIEQDELGKRIVAAWIKHQVPQCGYCQSGQIMATIALLRKTPRPTEEEIRAAVFNLCRCGTYNAIRAAVYDLAGHQIQNDAVVTEAEGSSSLVMGAGVVAGAAALTGLAGYAIVKTRKRAADSKIDSREIAND